MNYRDYVRAQLAHVISVFDEPTFLEHVRGAQRDCTEDWFKVLLEVAKRGENTTVQFPEGILCKLVDEYFAPAMPC